MTDPGTVSSWAALLAEGAACDDLVALGRLARRAARLEAAGGPPPGAHPLRLALLGGADVQLLADPLRLLLLVAGIRAELHVASYGSFAQELLDPDSATSRFGPELALVVLGPGDVPQRPAPGAGVEEAEALAAEACRALWRPCERLFERCGAETVLTTVPPVHPEPLGHLAARSPEAATNFVRRVNLRLGDTAPPCVHLLDAAALAARRGHGRWFDRRLWFEAKQPVAPAHLPELARHAAAVIGGLLGRSRKVLVLDLDDTLWGGVVGEVGVAALELGEGTPRGEAFKVFQQYLKQLRERGVLLAVCSKNEEANARAPFREHPETVLRCEDFAAFHASWEPKSAGLRTIATELGQQPENLVFLDDNPAERAEVRRALPQVAVPELGDDPAEYPRLLDEGAFFEIPRLTPEDRTRTELYRARRGAELARAQATDLSDFLASLEMRSALEPFGPRCLERVTQLVNKTNQFNLTGRRLTRAELESLASDPAAVTLAARLSDRFGDHGLVAAVFARGEGGVLAIDGWVMSCRVLRRGLSALLLNELVARARSLGARELHGAFRPSGRNELVREHYARLGFERVSANGREDRWRLPTTDYEPRDTFIALAPSPEEPLP